MAKNSMWRAGGAVVGFLMLASVARSATTARDRGIAGGQSMLEIGGAQAGWISSVAGGNVFAEVITEAAGADRIVHKHVGTPKFEDVSVGVGASMSTAFYGLVKGAIEGSPSRTSGAVLITDSAYNEQARVTFTNAVISEVAFPELNAASKEGAKIMVTFSPERSRASLGVGPRVGSKLAMGGPRKWVASAFRFTLDGMDTSRVLKIESIVSKTTFAAGSIGAAREVAKPVGKTEYSNLVIYVPEAPYGKPFQDWLESFVVNGQNDQSKEKKGRLEFLSEDLKTVFFALDLKGLGIVRADSDPPGAGESVRRMRVEMYIESMTFTSNVSQ